MSLRTRIGIVGAGAWGTALAIQCNRAGSDVILWSRNESLIRTIEGQRINVTYLPEALIDPAIHVTTASEDLGQCDMLLIVVPAQSFRTACIMLSDIIAPSIPLVIASKGIERGSLALMSDIANTILPSNPVAVLSGPNFANEVAKSLPSATTLACRDLVIGERIIHAIGTRMMRPYYSDDIIGTQVGGAVKNVVALACGIAAGKQLGENARAALITRGLSEMKRLARVLGGKEETLMGLCGIGDLMLTCSSRQSRNMSLGYALGEGKPIREVMRSFAHGLTEGVATADSVHDLALRLGIPMPICTAVYSIFREQVPVDEGIAELLDRPFARER